MSPWWRGWQARALLIALFSMTANQALRPMVTYRALELGATAAELGLVAGSFALLSSVFAVPLGRWIDRLGEPLFLAGGTGLLTVSALLLALSGNLPALIAAQALLGLGQVASLIGLQTLMANAGDPKERDGRFGVLTVVASLAQTIGPMVAGFAYGTRGMDLGTIFLLGAIPAALGVAMSLVLFARPPQRHERRGLQAKQGGQEPFVRSVRTVMRQPGVPHAMLASLTVLTSIDLLIAYLPAWGQANGIEPSTIGLMLGVRAAAGLASRVLMLRMLKKLTRRRLLVRSMLLPALALLLLPLSTEPIVLLVLLAISGFGLGLGQPLSLAWVSDQVAPEVRGTALGVRITGNRLAQLFVPMAAGLVAGSAGLGAIFVLTGALIGISSIGVSRAPSGSAAGGEDRAI
jgi:MFS family permease